MILFPAIDIKEGKVVRLLQGRFDHVTEYDKDPLKVAKHWKSQGAEWLHIVDLDGARTGKMDNIAIINRITREIGIPVQVGGGVRSLRTLNDLIELNGVSRVVLGTKALEDQDFLGEVLKKWPKKVAVSLDCINDDITKDGWVKNLGISFLDFIQYQQGRGLEYLIYTDVVRDGMLVGPNFNNLRRILEAISDSPGIMHVIASGGIGNIKHIEALHNMSRQYQGRGRLIGAITGKAIYEDRLDFKEALALLK